MNDKYVELVSEEGDWEFNNNLSKSIKRLQHEGHKIVDIKYSTCVCEGAFWHSALIIYE